MTGLEVVTQVRFTKCARWKVAGGKADVGGRWIWKNAVAERECLELSAQ